MEVPTQEWPKNNTAPKQILDRVKQMVLADRMVWKTSVVAFVAYLRAYKENKLHYLLPFKLLPFGQLATAFAMLKMPKVAELRDIRVTDFTPTQIDLDNLKFKKPQLEKQRLEKLRALQKAQHAVQVSPAARGKRGEPDRNAPVPDPSSDEDSDADVDEIMEDYRLMKKHKKRKISPKEYAKRTGELDLREDENE